MPLRRGGLGEPALPEAELEQHAVLPLPRLFVKPDPRLGAVLGLREVGGVGKRGAGLEFRVKRLLTDTMSDVIRILYHESAGSSSISRSSSKKRNLPTNLS